MNKVSFKTLLVSIVALSAAAQAAPQFEITDGKTNRAVLQLHESQNKAEAGQISAQWSQRPAEGTHPERWTVTLKNNASTDRWLNLNWKVSWDGDSDLAKLHYWFGRHVPTTGKADTIATGAELLKSPSIDASQNTLMLQTLYDGKKGLAQALPPDEILSQFHQTLVSANGKLQLHLRIPIALGPGESDSFPVEIYEFTPRYGYLDALQKYFLAHPDSFNPRKNIEPGAAGVGRNLRSLSYEEQRRSHGDWRWYYAPFRRPGDIYGRQKFWEYEPALPFGSRTRGLSAEEYRKKRHGELAQLREMDMTAAFYTPSFLYSELQLAEAEYPGAVIRNPDGTYTKHYPGPWVTTSGNDVAMYPWGNKFAEQSMEDARQLVAENDIPAFAYDVMTGGFKFRGEGMKQSPRRSFDEHGEYVDSGVAVAKIADFTRSLKNNGLNVALVGNLTEEGRPFLAARSDSIMFERPPYYYENQFRALRYAAGHKTITFWNAWAMETKNKSLEKLRSDLQDAADHIRLNSYRYGAFPSAKWSTGVPQMLEMLPLLKEVILKGWQPVPAVRGMAELPAFIWPARYGAGEDSVLTVGNNDKAPWQGEILVDNDYLGASNYLFVAVSGGKVLRQGVQGRTTKLQVQIPLRETLVLSAVAAVPSNAAGTASVNWQDDGASGNLSLKSTFAPQTVKAPRQGWTLTKNQGQNWQFASDYFGSSLEAILNFPYFEEHNTAQIVLPENPEKEEQWAAQRLQEYFKFWGRKGMEPAREINLPTSEKRDDSRPALVIARGDSKVTRQGQTLRIGGKSLRESIPALLSALDKKYFYTGVLPATAPLEKAELASKTLPYSR